MAELTAPEKALDSFLEKLDEYIDLKISNAPAHRYHPEFPAQEDEAPAYHKLFTALGELLTSVTKGEGS